LVKIAMFNYPASEICLDRFLKEKRMDIFKNVQKLERKKAKVNF
jgi:hypothetical protein